MLLTDTSCRDHTEKKTADHHQIQKNCISRECVEWYASFTRQFYQNMPGLPAKSKRAEEQAGREQHASRVDWYKNIKKTSTV